MAIRRIFCAMDFSETSDAALRVAIDIALKQQAELVIAHAWKMIPAAYSGFMIPGELIQAVSDNAEAALANALAYARKSGVVKASTYLLHGAPWEAIVTQSKELGADLIVMGTHGRTGIRRAVLGSVAEMVIRHAQCSVLAVPLDAKITSFHHVLCAIDFSPSARAARDLAMALCPADADFTFAHVVEIPSLYSEVSYVEVERHMVGEANQTLDLWVAEAKPRPAHGLLMTGNPTQELRTLIEKRNYDLVVMGSHGRTGLRRMFLGSVAEATVRHAHRAVLVARGALA
ncbi:MAG: universal stress protein [Kofleriaceae bacterium]